MATQRLPITSGDAGNWGTILNSYLRISHGAEGGLNVWTTATRPATPDMLASGINTTTNVIERWNGNLWEVVLSSSSASVTAPKSQIIVSASNSSLEWKALSQFICDGILDEVEINSAITIVKALGGEIKLAPGTYNIGNPITFNGASSQNSPLVSLSGVGVDSTIINVASNKNGIALLAAAKVNLMDFTIKVKGSGNGIVSNKAATTPLGSIDPGLRGFYLSSFRNIKVMCDDNSHTGF
jgi:hypothetical protein